MIRTLLWKEYREQRSVWLALPAFTALMLVGLWWVLEQASPVPGRVAGITDKRIALMGLAVILAGAYGVVSGAMLLANEREAGTQVFLDALTGRRAPLWWGKLLAGAVLTLSQSLLVVMVVSFVQGGDFGNGEDELVLVVVWLMALSWVALSALAWGMLTSAGFANVLAAAACAVILFGLSTLLSGMLSMLTKFFFRGAFGVMYVASQCGLTLAALEGSRRVFCRDDRSRAELAERTPPDRSTGRGRGRFSETWLSCRAVFWLAYRQGMAVVAALTGVALVLTVLLSAGSTVAWPLVSGLIGVACGLCTFAPEQASGAGRFLGVQRLPPGRVWGAKVAAWFAAACGIATLALIVEAITHWEALADLWAETSDGFTFLFLCLTYGFAVGQLWTLLVRKTAFAALLAGVLASGLVLLWLPSLVVGGLQAWQWLGVPLLLLLAGRLVVWPWWSGTFRDWRSLLPAVGCGLLGMAWIAGNLGHRALAIPDVGAPFDVAAFEASLPTPEQNQTGRLIRRAALEGNLTLLRKATCLAACMPADVPQGMLTDPRNQDPQLPQVLQALRPENFLLWKGCSDPASFVPARIPTPDEGLEEIVDLLALSRQVRYHAPVQVWRTGRSIEQQALEALEEWQLQVGDDPKLLTRALEELRRHEAELPPPADHVKATYLVFRADLDALNGTMSFPGVAFQAPWERARLERVGNALFAGWLRAAEGAPAAWAARFHVDVTPFVGDWLPPSEGQTSLTAGRLAESLESSPLMARFFARYQLWPEAVQALRKLRIAELQLAVTLYWAENPMGPPPSLKLLVPRYLPATLVDPLTEKPLQPKRVN